MAAGVGYQGDSSYRSGSGNRVMGGSGGAGGYEGWQTDDRRSGGQTGWNTNTGGRRNGVSGNEVLGYRPGQAPLFPACHCLCAPALLLLSACEPEIGVRPPARSNAAPSPLLLSACVHPGLTKAPFSPTSVRPQFAFFCHPFLPFLRRLYLQPRACTPCRAPASASLPIAASLAPPPLFPTLCLRYL